MFDEIIGPTCGIDIEYDFYGVDDTRFGIGTRGSLICTVFEAIDDRSDGYRSYLETIEVSHKNVILFHRPIAVVRIEKVEHSNNETATSYDFCGYNLIDISDGHTWLSVGTDYSNDCYPRFIFSYYPRRDK